MDERNEKNLTGHPSDYGSRTLTDEERERLERGEIGRTADGDPRVERGTADAGDSPEETSKG